jgi:iron complex transport system substrate-binding protein
MLFVACVTFRAHSAGAAASATPVAPAALVAPLVASPSLRVVSFAPHVTEILFALGAQANLVGVTEQCDFPPAAKALPRVGTYVQPNLESVLSTRAKLAFATEGNNRDTLERLRARGVEVVEVNPRTASALGATVRTVAEKVHRAREGEALALSLDAQLAVLRETSPLKKSFLLVLQASPLISATEDTWIGDLFREAGYRNIVPRSRMNYPVVSDELLVNTPPEVVFLTSSVTPRAMLTRLEVLLGPKRASQVDIVALPADVFERPGPRVREAFAFLRARSLPGRKAAP